MKQNELNQLLQQCEFSVNQPPPPENIVFRIEFSTIGSLGDYVLITGRPKAGKTKYLAGAMSASVCRAEVFGMKIKLPDEKREVAHFDTEQGKRSHFNLLNLMLQLMQVEEMPNHFKSYHCRQYNASQIVALIEHYLQLHPNTGLLFLDGLLDLIDSFNDEKHSKYLVNWLKRITEAHNLLIVAVLHRSMSVDKSIGHLGSSADRAAQSVLIVEKNKETKQYILKAEYLRDADDFAPIAIWYNKQLTIWEQTDFIQDSDQPQTNLPMRSMAKRRPLEYDISEHTAQVVRIFNSNEVLTYENLLQRIKEVYAVGIQWAKDCVPILEKENLIWRVEQGFTNVRQGRLLKIT